MEINRPDSALLLLAHGSTENPDSSGPTRRQAALIRKSSAFGSVHCAFWKEEPSFRQVTPMLEEDEVYVVPHFISEGYFTRQIIPRELELTGKTTVRGSRKFHYCDPVGNHSSMTDLLLHKAIEILPDDIYRENTAMIIAGHGTEMNKNSALAIQRQVTLLKEANTGFAEIAGGFMEEAPFLSQWDTIVKAAHVVVIPFFIADGLHSVEDIPGMLGIELLSPDRKTVYEFGERSLQYATAIGDDPLMTRIILDQVAHFDQTFPSPATS